MDSNLENRIKALEDWRKEKEAQQIKFPLDNNSIEVLKKYFMRLEETIRYIGGVSGNEFELYLGTQDNLEFQVARKDFFQYTADPSSDELTTNVYLLDDTQVVILSSGTPPNPLVSGAAYYVVNSSGTTFELSSTLGGPTIDITDTGTGNQYLNLL